MIILQEVKSYCIDILEGNTCKKLPYHNLLHTSEVVEQIKKTLKHYSIPTNQEELIIIAAWFHDVGFCKTYFGHEDESKRLALQFLRNSDYPANKIQTILNCIEATKMPQNPQNLLEQIVCDSDLFHLGKPDFFDRNKLLRIEWANECGSVFTDQEWYKLNLKFLKNHTFLTNYAQQELKKGKQINIDKLESLISSDP